MAKLTRFTAKIFGSGAGTDQISVFGSLFAGSSAFTTVPATAQSLSNWLTGWLGAAIGGNAPAIEDMNACFFVLSYLICYILQEGVAEWDAGTTYYENSLVSVAGVTYYSIQDDNTNHAVTNSAWWAVQNNLNVVSKVSTDDGYAPKSGEVVLWDSTGGDSGPTLPAFASNVNAEVTVKKIDTSTNLVNIGGTIDGVSGYTLSSPGDSATFVANASGWWRI